MCFLCNGNSTSLPNIHLIQTNIMIHIFSSKPTQHLCLKYSPTPFSPLSLSTLSWHFLFNPYSISKFPSLHSSPFRTTIHCRLSPWLALPVSFQKFHNFTTDTLIYPHTCNNRLNNIRSWFMSVHYITINVLLFPLVHNFNTLKTYKIV